MRSSWFLVSALAALVAADEPGTTTIKYFGVINLVNGVDLGGYSSTAARVVTIGKYATTYEVACLEGASQCALNHPATIVQGPTTYSASIEATVVTAGATAIGTNIEHCSFTRVSESVVCTWSFEYTASYGDVTTSISDSSSESIAASSISYQHLTITDGAYALTGAATASASGVKVTPTASSGAAAGAAKPLITAAPLGAAAFAAFAAML
ncbi:hypothetical protein N7491_001448 [Penicillium cf. griseofulvum]|uniref:Ig-like domain-containing protein n=1 Tax=Penicillium cf. griseofulvum TaxID=2972120 RepID=A0A9W9JBQ6_9EURO|nr:hypothetical protein N7472_006579 [Penicillium cf. griseofulvum]KAJ5445366.1 hypothetical protein N7491_001448 [Penicillium cf. griseofulvum]KAJ5447085.1 hypothetical protein N7445_001906 [Penicillium cf. griseofulvum]